jgi:eukaryotic-like serine/threonine-protein kinase
MDDHRILEHQPLPLARCYRRWRNAAEVRERHDAAYYLFEIYLKYAASIAIAHYLAGEARDHRVNAALKGLARPSLGEWLRFLRECLRFLVEGKEPERAVAAIASLFEAKEAHSEPLRALFNGLRSFRAGSPSDRDKLSLSMLLEEVVSYRNRVLGHGAPPGKEHLKRFGDLFAEAFPDLIDRSPYLTARRLVAFDSLQVEEKSRIECGVVEYMSDRPMRRKIPHTIPYGSEAPEKDRLYLLGEDGRFVPLYPLLVINNEAQDEDVYFLNEVDGGSPEYLSYTTGARHRPAGATEAQAKLFERILGYRVDASMLSRIGDDLAPGAEAQAKAGPEDGARRLGDYRIVREVGRGAMGMVFEAVQESLGRRVALKTLPGDFALDPQRAERFRREARATARIHHPSIVPVYEAGEAEGTHFYAMEFIDGPSLDRLIEEARKKSISDRAKDGKKHGSPSPSDSVYITQAVESVAELAEGLGEAHRQGLIHRDVKPSNILVGADGRWVLVDFGLVREEEARALTRSGEMVGTLAYMSPEQVSRNKVDPRADVYSLGVTLYEILTLRLPHEGPSDHEVQRAILFEEPIPARKLNPRLHRDLETVLQKALEKNPERRYASAGALAADLRRCLRGEAIEASPATAWTRILRRAKRHGRLAGAALVIACILIATLSIWRPWAPRAFILEGIGRLTFDGGITTDPALSPDGKLLAYASDRGEKGETGSLDLWIQELDAEPRPRRLTSDPEADEREPAFSPDGREIAFRSERLGGGIHAIPASGGKDRLLVKGGRRPLYSPDGKWILYWIGELGGPARGSVFVVPSQGGTPVQLGGDLAGARKAIWAPGGDHVLFLGFQARDVQNSPNEGTYDWWVAPLAGGSSRATHASRLLLEKDVHVSSCNPVRWGLAAHGSLLLFTYLTAEGEYLWSIEIDPSTFEAAGTPLRLTRDLSYCARPWIAHDGSVFFAHESRSLDIWSLPIESKEGKTTGPLVNLTRDDALETSPAISVDGKRVIYSSNKHGHRRMWVKNTETDDERPLTPPEWVSWNGQVTKGETGYRAAVDSTAGLMILEMETAKAVNVTPEKLSPECWSPDGQKILCIRGGRAFEVDVATGKSRLLLADPARDIWETRYSPDGAWLAFDACPKAARTSQDIYVAELRDGQVAPQAEWIQITEPNVWNDKPRWSPDGSLLYYISERDGFRCIYAQRLDPTTRRPLTGSRIEVQHFHSARLSPLYINLADLKMGVAVDRLVINLAELKSNVWMARLEETRGSR